MASERKSGPALTPVKQVRVNAIHLDDPEWNVKLVFGEYSTGIFERFLTVAEARALAAGLIAAADHYDAETARLAGGSVPDSLPVDIPAPVDPADKDTCESGEPDCGPVEHWDSDGTGLCARCYDSLEASGELLPPFPTADGLDVSEVEPETTP